MSEWKVRKLKDITDIRVSNVDKKLHAGKASVKLCNYMDIYTNDYIRNRIPFQIGSADANELSRFSLFLGDVIITKDSETPDDIAIPAVVNEQIDNLVCGYHLAILRPSKMFVDGCFLMHKLKLPEVRKYFFQVANGSTRYGLTIGNIETVSFTIPTSLSEQHKIARILSTVDAVIEKTEEAIAKYKAIKAGMMRDLFTRGIDLKTGKLRPRYEDAPELYKESELGWVPREWEVVRLDYNFSLLRSGLSRLLSEHDIGIPVLISGNIQENKLDYSNLKYWYEDDTQGADVNSYILAVGDILLCFINSIDQIGKVAIFEGFKRPCIYTTNLFRIKSSAKSLPKYLYYLLCSNIVQNEIQSILKPAVNQASFTTKEFSKMMVPYIPNIEQIKIIDILEMADAQLKIEQRLLNKHQQLKSALMSDLLTGKVRVKYEEENKKVKAM